MLTWEIISSMTLVQVCRASDPQEKEMSVMEEGLIDQLEMDEINGSLAELFPEEKLEFKEVLLGVISGDLNFSADLLNRLVMDQISYAFRVSKENLVHILLITVIAAVLHNFSTIFQNRQISEISFYVVYMLLIALTLNSFEVVIDWVSEGVENMTSFMGVFCPLYFLAVSIAKGSVTAVAFYQLVLFLIYLVEILISKILLPIIHVYMMVRVLNFLSAEEYIMSF